MNDNAGLTQDEAISQANVSLANIIKSLANVSASMDKINEDLSANQAFQDTTNASLNKVIDRLEDVEARARSQGDLLLTCSNALSQVADRLDKIEARLLLCEVQIKARTKPTT